MLALALRHTSILKWALCGLLTETKTKGAARKWRDCCIERNSTYFFSFSRVGAIKQTRSIQVSGRCFSVALQHRCISAWVLLWSTKWTAAVGKRLQLQTYVSTYSFRNATALYVPNTQVHEEGDEDVIYRRKQEAFMCLPLLIVTG